MRRYCLVFLLAAVAAFPADPALMKLVMPNARFIAGINMARVRQTPFGQWALAQFSASEDESFDQFVTASGFDPRKNLDEIIIAAPAAGEGRRLIVARGAFTPARILALAHSAGAEVSSISGVDVISNGSAAAASPQSTPMAFSFLSDTVALAGDPDSVRDAVARRASATGPARDIAAKVAAVSGGADAWFVSTVPVSELAQGLPGSNAGAALKGEALKSIEQASGGVTFGRDVKFNGELITHTADDAASLSEVLRFLAGVVQLSQNRQGPGRAPLDALTLTAEGNIVRLVLSIPESQLESMLKQAGAGSAATGINIH